MGWLGGLSLLSSGLVFAKAPMKPGAYIPDAASDYAPQPAPQPVPDYAPQPTPQAPPPPTNDYRGVSPDAVFEQQPASEAIAPPEPINPPQLERPTLPPQHSYIDSTDYSLGATSVQAEDAPVVVFEERSTGCAATVNGRVTGDLCAPQPAAQPTRPVAPAPRGGVVAANSAPTYSAAAPAPSGFAPIPANVPGVSADRLPSVNFNYAQMEAQLRRDMAVQPLGSQFGNGDRRLIFPLAIPAPISSFFGWRIHPIAGTRRFHTGTDIGAPMGTPVLAAFTGRVAVAEMLGGYGMTVILEHNDGTAETLYAHMSELLVRPGQEVQQGQVIGRVGSTGYSTGPHLHFEVKQLTEQGWVFLDAGRQLELALAELIDRIQVAQAPTPEAPEAAQ